MSRSGGTLDEALSAVAEHAELDPASVWSVVLEYGSSDDETKRAAVAVGLLEHLLEQHYDTYFPLLKGRVEDGDANLADTLQRCWLFGGVKRHSREVDRLLSSAGERVRDHD